MKLAFVLPNTTNRAMGGYKVVYQYANYMVEHGHDVTIIYDNEQMLAGHYSIFSSILKVRANLYLHTEPKWFPLNTKIKKKNVFYLLKSDLIGYDIIVATARITAEYIHREGITAEKVLYLIQDFEDWGCSEADVYETYKYGYENIVISKQLAKIVRESTGKAATYLPDGIDTNNFKISVPLEKRPVHSIAMMYRNSWRKGYPDGLEVFKQLKELYPDLKGYMFGVDRRPNDLPGWIEFIYRANQRKLAEIYNSVRIYLSPSLQEGYGLTGLESMACGCALVSTDTLGVHEYAEDGITASIVPVADVSAMINKVVELFERVDLLTRRSEVGMKCAAAFSVEKMGARFMKIAEERLKEM